MSRALVIGSRGSDLALWQSRRIRSLLKERASVDCEIRVIKTQGDRIDTLPFEKMEGKGFFTKEIEEALLRGDIDLAVHSLKDLPTESPPGLVIAAIPERVDPRDLLLITPDAHDPARHPLPLKQGATVGTSAARRKAQLEALAPDLDVAPLRGNVPTRVQRVKEGRHDAILIALAGVQRLELDLAGLVQVPLDPETFAPAPGQGALAVQIRADDPETADAVATLHDPDAAARVEAERSLLGRFGGGCSLPLGAHLVPHDGGYRVFAFWDPTDAPPKRVVQDGPDLRDLMNDVFDALSAGSNPDNRSASAGATSLRGKTVVVTRPGGATDRLARLLAELGANVIPYPVTRIEAHAHTEEAVILGDLERYDWVLFPSANAVGHFWDRLASRGATLPDSVKVGVVGSGTARALVAQGRKPDLVPEEFVAESLLEAVLDRCSGECRILIPSALDGREVLAQGLEAAGHLVQHLPVYRTVSVDPTELDPGSVAPADYVLFASPSAVRAFLDSTPVPDGARIVAIGPVTSEAIRERGLTVHAEAEPHTVEGLIQCLVTD